VPLNNNNTTTESKIETLTPFLQEIMGESEWNYREEINRCSWNTTGFPVEKGLVWDTS
jgi:hypothetical protein